MFALKRQDICHEGFNALFHRFLLGRSTKLCSRSQRRARCRLGRLVMQTGWAILSGDGKTHTVTTGGTGPNGQAVNSVAVPEKQ